MDLSKELLKTYGFKNDRDGIPYKRINGHTVSWYPNTNVLRVIGDNCDITVRGVSKMDELVVIIKFGTGKEGIK